MPARYQSELPGVWLDTPYYDEDFVDEIKSLPKRSRRWNPERKQWWVAQDVLYRARIIFERYYGFSPDNQGSQRRPPPPPPPQREPAEYAHYRSLHLLPTAPAELVKAAYRTLSQLYHPDHGGDVQKQTAINLAYEQIGKRQ